MPLTRLRRSRWLHRARISVDQRTRPATVRTGLWAVDTRYRRHVDQAEVRREVGGDGGRCVAGQARTDPAEATAARLPTRCASHRALAAGVLPGHCGTGSAVNSRGAFWFCVYPGALNAELFVDLLQRMMNRRKKPVHLVLDSLPAHKKANVREYVQSTEGKLRLHFLPGYAPDLNPDELVWSHVKRTGTARRPLQAGEKLDVRIDAELHAVQRNPKLVRSFFQAPPVAYISDC